MSARLGTISRGDEIVVFSILRDSACAECGEALGKGRFLRLEKERPLCLRCTDLDHLHQTIGKWALADVN